TDIINIDLDPGGTVTARASGDIYITETSGDMNVATMFSQTGGVFLTTLSGSIVDGLNHEFEKIRANGIVLTAVGGGICESGDFLAKERRLPPVQRGDLICIFSAGAYGFTMSSQYNSRPRVAEVLIDGSTTRLIRRRETYDDLVALERDEAISSS
ncbi:MAG: diaminopimelate decarboxylase, partial [Planctomycetes bacterium]|nr:diaminopimelate decarboxylase [Planctomycetota bacterium]